MNIHPSRHSLAVLLLIAVTGSLATAQVPTLPEHPGFDIVNASFEVVSSTSSFADRITFTQDQVTAGMGDSVLGGFDADGNLGTGSNQSVVQGWSPTDSTGAVGVWGFPEGGAKDGDLAGYLNYFYPPSFLPDPLDPQETTQTFLPTGSWTFLADHKYRLEVWFRGSQAGQPDPVVGLYTSSGLLTPTHAETPEVGTDWTQWTLDYLLGTDTVIEKLGIGAPITGATGYVYFDALSITSESPGIPDPEIPEPATAIVGMLLAGVLGRRGRHNRSVS